MNINIRDYIRFLMAGKIEPDVSKVYNVDNVQTRILTNWDTGRLELILDLDKVARDEMDRRRTDKEMTRQEYLIWALNWASMIAKTQKNYGRVHIGIGELTPIDY